MGDPERGQFGRRPVPGAARRAPRLPDGQRRAAGGRRRDRAGGGWRCRRDRRDDDLARRVIGATGGAAIRLGIDAVGGTATGRLADCLCDDAILVNYGRMSDASCTVQPDAFIFRNLTMRGFWLVDGYGKRPRESARCSSARSPTSSPRASCTRRFTPPTTSAKSRRAVGGRRKRRTIRQGSHCPTLLTLLIAARLGQRAVTRLGARASRTSGAVTRRTMRTRVAAPPRDRSADAQPARAEALQHRPRRQRPERARLGERPGLPGVLRHDERRRRECCRLELLLGARSRASAAASPGRASISRANA